MHISNELLIGACEQDILEQHTAILYQVQHFGKVNLVKVIGRQCSRQALDMLQVGSKQLKLIE
jgi:hypothetical protein